jgi:hypothetical protein
MKLKARFWIALLLIGILSCVVLPSVNAETFDIGEKIESDLKNAIPVYHPFSSGAIVRADDFEMNLTSFIFDGNLNTGIETNFSMGELDWKVYFRFPLYVNNITVKPDFRNGSSNFGLTVFVVDTINRGFSLSYNDSGERVFQMNCYISAIELNIRENGTNQFYFNDVIINYSPTPPYLEGLQNQIHNLNNSIFRLGLENAQLINENENLTSELIYLELKIENLTEVIGQEDDPDTMDLFSEPPFVGLLWVILITVIILDVMGYISNEKRKREVMPEPMEDQPPSPESEEPEESQPPEKEKEVGGRFCPNCGKFTDEKGAFCPHCKRSME